MVIGKKKAILIAVLSVFLILPGCNKKADTSSQNTSSDIDSSIPSSSEPDNPPGPGPTPTEYVVRNDNYLNFHIITSGSRADYYYYFEYHQDYFHISVDAVDPLLTNTFLDIGYNDNIEFNIQPLCNDTRYSPDKTFNMMLNLASPVGWFKKATGTTSLSGDQIDYYRDNHLIAYDVISREKYVDGYDGASVEIDLSYDIWGMTYDSLYGRLTIEPAARNCEVSGNEFRSYVQNGCRFSYAYTAVVVNGDGTYSQNNGEVSELSSLMVEKGLIYNNKELASNFATMTDNSRAKKFEAGAQLFSDRKYFVSDGVTPRELLGKTYQYNKIDSNNFMTINKAGYVVILAPHDGYASLKSTIIAQGFTLVNDKPGKQIGFSSSAIIGISEQSDYYVKWCEKNNVLVFEKWCVVFTKELESYQTLNRWEKELAQVHKISSPEALAEYAPSKRLWQGIPGIEWSKRDDGGSRLWASLFSGGTHEPTIYNYTTYYFSDDDGESWTLAFVVDFLGSKEDDSRCFDPSIKFYNGKLYIYWNQTGEAQYTNKVCCAIVNNPGIEINQMSDIDNFEVGAPFFCSRGIKMNKPIILTTGEWLYAAHDPAAISYVEIYSSLDNGLNWSLKGRSKVDNVLFVTESTLVQIDDEGKELVLYSRTDISYYQAVSYSHDGGATWTVSEDEGRICPNSRQFAYRLASGNILFAHHYNSYSRENMFVGLSTNGCQSYDHNLILDVRNGTSYPDITQAEDGSIYVTWDYDRYGMKQVLFAKLNEQDLLAIDGVETMSTNLIKEICCIVATNHTYSIKGRIVDSSANPVQNATISCGSVNATSDTNGYYELKGIAFASSGYNQLTVSKNGYTPYELNVFNDDAIDYNYHLTKNVTLQETKIASYSGKVTDISGASLQGVEVFVDGVSKTTTNASGEFLINNMEVKPYDFSFSFDGYKTISLRVNEYTDGSSITLDTLTMLKSTQCDLGEIGGTNANRYHLFSERGDEGIYFYAIANSNIVSNNQGFEAWINVYGFSKARSINTSFYRFKEDGTFVANYMPNNSSKALENTTGMTNNVSGKTVKGYVPYSVIGQHLPSGISVNKDTELALNFITISSSGSQYDYWQAEDIPGIKDSMTGQIDKFNTKKYLILKADNTLSTEHSEIYTFDVIKSLVESSSAYQAGIAFSKNNLAMTLSTKNTQVEGGTMYSNRAASVHGFDDFRIKALDGYSFIYTDVLADVTFTATKSGYVLVMYNAATYSTPDGFVDIIVNYSNPGLASSPSHALFNYAVMYVQNGQTITVPQSSLVYIN